MRLSLRFSILGLLMGLLALSGCATRKFVRNEVATIEPKLADINTKMTETGERVDAVDRRAQQGIAAAGAADQKATAAGQAASVADGKAVAADRKADTANTGVQQANNRITAVEGRFATLDTYTPGQSQAITFRVNSATLTDEAKQALDTIANGLTGQQSGFFIEIQGYTDTTGSEAYNATLSQRRADSVLRYLVGKGVPLFRTSIVGLGEDKPIGDNTTRQGREQNRRVEVRVLRSAAGRSTN